MQRAVLKRHATVAIVTAVVVLTQQLSETTAANVLAIEPLPARSHWNFMRAVLRVMAADGGHNVTVYTPFATSAAEGGCPDVCGRRHRGDGAGVAGCGYAEVPLQLDDLPDKVSLDVATAVANFASERQFIEVAVNKSRTACKQIDRMAAAGRFAAVRYDLAVVELVSSECTSRVSGVLGDVPLVYLFPSPMASWVEAKVLGTSPGPSYAARLFARHAALDTFARRLDNAYGWSVTEALQWFYELDADASGYRKPAVTFVNSDRTVEEPVPTLPNMIRIGGVHLPPPEPVPPDILEFIENSPNGVIVLTFGTVVALSTLTDEIQKAFKDAIAEVPQRVLMKYESEMQDKPKNVMTSKWLPQRDVLLHPKVKLFISHGGISGVYEAVDAGVPVLGFPLFYDQPRNVANLVSAGMAISLDLFSITKDNLLKSINEIVNNKTYEQNAKKVSKIFKDRPISLAQSVVYWTDYVIRHKGAPHLKSQAFNLSWYQYFLLDVIVLVLFVFVLAFCITYIVLKLVKYCIFKLSPKLKPKSD